MYAKTILMGVMAHECGHICLGHLPYRGQDMHCSISRNDERQADSWASAVLQSCCLGAQGAVAAVMMIILLGRTGLARGNSGSVRTRCTWNAWNT